MGHRYHRPELEQAQGQALIELVKGDFVDELHQVIHSRAEDFENELAKSRRSSTRSLKSARGMDIASKWPSTMPSAGYGRLFTRQLTVTVHDCPGVTRYSTNSRPDSLGDADPDAAVDHETETVTPVSETEEPTARRHLHLLPTRLQMIDELRLETAEDGERGAGAFERFGIQHATTIPACNDFLTR